MIPLGGWTGRIVLSGTGRFGVRPDEFASLGEFASPLLACVDPGDEATEFTWVIRSLPSSGTLTANDDGGMSHVGAADGVYVIPFGLYTWAPGGPGVYEGDTTFSTSFGALIAASEADSALPLAGVQVRATGVALEVDQAFALSAAVPGSAGVAEELDQAIAPTALQVRAVGLSSETDTALALNPGSSAPVGAAAESDSAFALAAVQRMLAGIALETDSALTPAAEVAPPPAPLPPPSSWPGNRSGGWSVEVSRPRHEPERKREPVVSAAQARAVDDDDDVLMIVLARLLEAAELE